MKSSQLVMWHNIIMNAWNGYEGGKHCSIFSAAMATATGYVILEAAQAEDTIGELVVLIARQAGCGGDPHKWWSSGEQLLDELRRLDKPELGPISQLYARLIPLRNDVVHGLTLDNAGVIMKRVKITKKMPRFATYEWSFTSIAEREQLAAEFRVLEQMAADAISNVMEI